MLAGRILIIDDDGDLRLGLDIRLRANLYATSFATDAAEALRVARRENPDLILLDPGVAGGEGYALMEGLRTDPQLCKVPVLVLTAWDDLSSKNLANEVGAVGFFSKPIDNRALLAAIRQVLGGPLAKT